MTRRVIAAGYTVLDVVSADGCRWHAAGGTAANIAANLAYLGWQSRIAARIGTDTAGQAVHDNLVESGVDVSLLMMDPATATPIVHHIVGESDHKYRFGCRECGRGAATHRPLPPTDATKHPELADIFVFDRPSVANLQVAEAHARGLKLVLYEPSTRATPERHRRACATAKIIKYSSQRRAVVGPSLPEVKPDQLLIVTHGAGGSEFRLGRRTYDLPAAKVAARDSGGAGDWMTAGLIHLLPRDGNDLHPAQVGEALAWAQTLAALSTMLPGARTLAAAASRASTLARVRRLTNLSTPRFDYEPQNLNGSGRCAGCSLPK